MKWILLVLALATSSAKSVKRDGDFEFEQNDFYNEPMDIQQQYNDLMSNEIPNDFTDLYENDYDVSRYNDDEDEEKNDQIDTTAAVVDENEEEVNVTEMYLKNPCIAITCSGGAMCVVRNRKERRTECVCPTNCPDDDDPVCSVYGKEYPSKCHLHLEACAQKRTIDIAYEGSCVVKNGACSDDELGQFAPRFMDWLMHIRDEQIDGEANMKKNIIDLPPERQIHIAQWMFDRMDTSKNKQLEFRELINLTTYLMSVESCIDEFLRSCDGDQNGAITIPEWKLCLLPGSNSVEDTYFDDIFFNNV